MFYAVVLVGSLVIHNSEYAQCERGAETEERVENRYNTTQSDDSSLMIAINVCCLEIKKKHRKEPWNAA